MICTTSTQCDQWRDGSCFVYRCSIWLDKFRHHCAALACTYHGTACPDFMGRLCAGEPSKPHICLKLAISNLATSKAFCFILLRASLLVTTIARALIFHQWTTATGTQASRLMSPPHFKMGEWAKHFWQHLPPNIKMLRRQWKISPHIISKKRAPLWYRVP